MKYDFIEIGTSDFRTQAFGSLKGIIVEPVKKYIDNIPDREGLIKHNCAICHEYKKVKIYFCCPDYIEEKKLPQWLRGCNSIMSPHPSVGRYCIKNGIDYDSLVKVKYIECLSLSELFMRNNVTELDFLKIDTEGSDYDIMISLFRFMDEATNVKVNKIQFESNILMTDIKKKEIIMMAVKAGYSWETMKYRGTEDTILTIP